MGGGIWISKGSYIWKSSHPDPTAGLKMRTLSQQCPPQQAQLKPGEDPRPHCTGHEPFHRRSTAKAPGEGTEEPRWQRAPGASTVCQLVLPFHLFPGETINRKHTGRESDSAKLEPTTCAARRSAFPASQHVCLSLMSVYGNSLFLNGPLDQHTDRPQATVTPEQGGLGALTRAVENPHLTFDSLKP